MSAAPYAVNPSFIRGEVLELGSTTQRADPTIPTLGQINKPYKMPWVRFKVLSCKTVRPEGMGVGSRPAPFDPAKPYDEVEPEYPVGSEQTYYLPDLKEPLRVGDVFEARTPEMTSYHPTLFDVKKVKKRKKDN